VFETVRRLAVAVLLVAAGCGGGDSGGGDSGPLSPARQLAGTWKTSLPVTIYFDTDWCTPTPSPVASQQWTVTWVVTPGANDNTVDVEMRFATASTQVIAGCPGTGVVPEVSPMFLTGNVSAATLTLRKGSDELGTFTFTSDILQGDFDYSFCIVYCQSEYSRNREFILRRQ
jgi:hypothetical protein